MKKLADISQFESVCGIQNQGAISDLSVFNLSGDVGDFDDLEYGDIVFDTKRGRYIREVWRKSNPEDVGYVAFFDFGGGTDGSDLHIIFDDFEMAKHTTVNMAKDQKFGGGEKLDRSLEVGGLFSRGFAIDKYWPRVKQHVPNAHLGTWGFMRDDGSRDAYASSLLGHYNYPTNKNIPTVKEYVDLPKEVKRDHSAYIYQMDKYDPNRQTVDNAREPNRNYTLREAYEDTNGKTVKGIALSRETGEPLSGLTRKEAINLSKEYADKDCERYGCPELGPNQMSASRYYVGRGK